LASLRKHKLSVFLIKQNYQAATDFIAPEIEHTVQIPLTPEVTGTLFYSTSHPIPPTWASIFEGIEEFDKAKILNQHSKALLVFKTNDRWFCFTFGYAKHLINQGAYERNFGLIVALNLSDPTSLKSIDKTNISLNPIQSRNQASREVEIESFGFNNDIDILKSVTARTQKDDVNDEDQTISGRDSISISSIVELNTFPDIAASLLEAFNSKSYLEKYPWFDKIIQERDVSIIQKLDQLLLEKIRENDIQKIWLAFPEIVHWENTEGFSYKQYKPSKNVTKPGPAILLDIDLGGWLNTIEIEKLTIEQLHHKHIYVIDKESRTIDSINVYRCLNAEVVLEDKTYILNDGDWYNINTNFESEINQFYDQIEDSAFSLPPYENMTEPVYLQHVVNGNNSLCLMDRKLIKYSGNSTVEFCDLYSDGKQIIHVKNYAGSSVLSHLFNQALVSAQCFMVDESFREKVNEKLCENFQLADTVIKPNGADFEICLAIMSNQAGVLDLPFFSKVSIKNVVTTIRGFGYKVTKLKINRFA
jgi:uncharacterized protein (TIGR04141 family)